MTMPDDLESEDNFEGIFQGEISSTLESHARTKFKPWHKPRKHFVRLYQWCHETRQLLKKLNLGDNGELRYLGLPGEDLLDIRVLQGVCQKAKVKLRYIGFDSSLTSAQLNLSRHEVNSGNFIHPSSVVTPDRLEELASLDSMAFKSVDRHSPFDVINLDLCDSVTAAAQDGKIPNLEAIRTLCDVQIKRRGQPWLLFLTTRVIRENLDQKTTQLLFDRLLKNISENGGFSATLNSKLNLSVAQIKSEMQATASLDKQGWLSAYVLAVSKWLLHYMMANGYVVTVRMLPSYSYSVHRDDRDMVSLAFLLEPASLSREDDTQLTKPRAAVVAVASEINLAEELVDQVAKIEDIDRKLDSDKALKVKMLTKCGALLSTLRYDMVAYKAFASAD
jgi:hypothetical protein